MNAEAVRVPPHSVGAEQGVLGGLLLDNRAWDRLGGLLTAEDFYRHDHRLIFGTASALLNASKPANVLTIQTRYKLRATRKLPAACHRCLSEVPSNSPIGRAFAGFRGGSTTRLLPCMPRHDGTRDLGLSDEAIRHGGRPYFIRSVTDQVMAYIAAW